MLRPYTIMYGSYTIDGNWMATYGIRSSESKVRASGARGTGILMESGCASGQRASGNRPAGWAPGGRR